MMRQYETTFIIDAQLPSEEIEAKITQFVQFIEKHGGKIKTIDRWGKRRLAYEIDKKQYGYYVYIRFESDGTLIAPLEKEFRLDESVVRSLVLKLPKALLMAEERAAVPKPAPSILDETPPEEEVLPETP